MASSLYTQATTGGTAQVGQFNPGALNIEFDVVAAPMHEVQANSWIRLYGIGVQALGQSWDLNPVDFKFKTFTLKGGMSKGLPLANPMQSGLLVGGNVFEAFGNWEGLNQTLDLICLPGPPAPDHGVLLTWKKGQPLSQALLQTFAQAYPGITPTQPLNISPNLIASHNMGGTYPDLATFSQHLQEVTLPLGAQIAGKDYPGVNLAVKGQTIAAWDGKGPTPPRKILLDFQDMIGQPTWISPAQIAFGTVLRADINLFDEVTFPTGLKPPYILTSSAAAVPGTPASNQLIFASSFVVTRIEHFANFRQADGGSWKTLFYAIPTNAVN